MPFKIVRNDITKVKADIIVNTANPNPICVSGTDLAIYEAAGKEKLLAERANIGKIARGDIAVTGAYSLNAKYIIHTVGPVWTDGLHHEFEILEDCYRKSLQKALELKCDSIAFPLISTGVYGFPKDKALQIAVSVFSRFLTENEIEIILRKALWAKGYRYRKNYKKLPGNPDIVLTKYKIAIFCDGEFFHGKDWEVLKPRLEKSNNSEFWISKISRNRERDDEVNKRLLFEGWTVIRFWGDDIKKHTDECVKVVEEAIFDLNFDESEDFN